MKKEIDLSIYNGLPSSSLVNTKSLFLLIGVHRSNSTEYIKLGKVPTPDVSFCTGSGFFLDKKRMFWKLGTLRKFFKVSE